MNPTMSPNQKSDFCGKALVSQKRKEVDWETAFRNRRKEKIREQREVGRARYQTPFALTNSNRRPFI
ncbi:hypothetical protein HRTV-25_gp3 [Halorubrum tailed virus 25]|uniref:Uncharacterized protein n=1 Tax=Halorubrum tailed virus 25 TaxID=2878006 RepID=A0AAE9BY70_9CAUD|nr:hypothetical protein M1M37_gp003 [Halorubrum tailed virus 25]UBF22584.1 hypothetical protein HRTV-25_gp3 [Halorubrum tailed virus 25]